MRAGRTLTILDRDTAIARIVPWQDNALSMATRDTALAIAAKASGLQVIGT